MTKAKQVKWVIQAQMAGQTRRRESQDTANILQQAKTFITEGAQMDWYICRAFLSTTGCQVEVTEQTCSTNSLMEQGYIKEPISHMKT